MTTPTNDLVERLQWRSKYMVASEVNNIMLEAAHWMPLPTAPEPKL